ncbi:hypothetical protein PV04_02936 [Phialophora macrospora]|uniref:Zn(2)-C6 fungal-type domain-containing protein n=1 Tax=Phialophora macrospora TaxID=1851006 RepID=A0A0D2CZL9_9EURO|nr:hypothetical protein PV04_02936 [Phialophora macrospora]
MVDFPNGGGEPRPTGQHGASLADAKAPAHAKKRPRELGARSRLGCGTCKKKRIKCDQTWPVCQKCKAATLVCDGYGVWGGGGKPYGPDGYRSKSPRPPRPEVSRACGGSLTHTFGTGMSPEQHASFEMLRLKMGVKLSGIFDSDFWDKLVLQASVDEPAVLHAVAAIGSAYRSDRLAKNDHGYGQTREVSNREMDSEGTRALLEYNMAIRCLTAHLSRTDICSLRVALITCMLFICFEYLRRNLRTGDTHLVNGLRLLRDIQARRGAPGGDNASVVGNPPDSLDDHLFEAFARLNLQCALFGLGLPFTEIPRRRDRLCSFEIPSAFESLQQARRQLDEILSGTYHLLLQCCQNEGGHSHGDEPDLDAFHRDQLELKAGLARWLHTYDTTLARSTANLTTTLAYMILRMYHTMGTIIVSVCHPLARESDFDHHTAAFVSIIEQAVDLSDTAKAHILMSQRRSPFSKQKRTFTVDMGFIPVLYYTALKCRVPRIRRQAAKLMEVAPHREGVWDGKFAAAIARRVFEIEEGECFAGFDVDGEFDMFAAPSPGDWATLPTLPEESKIYQVNVMLPEEGLANTTLQCIRRRWDAQDGGWHMERRNYSVTSVFRH